jgi:hypothetical protein
LQHDNSIVARSPRCPPSNSFLSASDTFVASSTSIVSPLTTTDSSTASIARLNLVVDFSSYPLQQDTTLSSSLPTLPPIVSKHPMVLHLWQPKIANLSVFVATVTPTSWVMSFSTSEPIAFFDAERYKVWHDAMRDEI